MLVGSFQALSGPPHHQYCKSGMTVVLAPPCIWLFLVLCPSLMSGLNGFLFHSVCQGKEGHRFLTYGVIILDSTKHDGVIKTEIWVFSIAFR